MGGTVDDEDGWSLYASGPLPISWSLWREGPKAVLPPVTIVWPCLLSVDEYLALGRHLELGPGLAPGARVDRPAAAARLRLPSRRRDYVATRWRASR